MSRFAAQLAANDREHVERLEAIADAVGYAAAEAEATGAPYLSRWLRNQAQAIRDEIARWKRPHPMGGEP